MTVITKIYRFLDCLMNLLFWVSVLNSTRPQMNWTRSFILLSSLLMASALRVYRNCKECDIPSDFLRSQPRPYWPWSPGYRLDQPNYVWPLYFSGWSGAYFNTLILNSCIRLSNVWYVDTSLGSLAINYNLDVKSFDMMSATYFRWRLSSPSREGLFLYLIAMYL